MKDLIVAWLQAGAPFDQGARLFSLLAGKRHPFGILARRKSKGAEIALKLFLCRFGKVPVPAAPAVVKNPTSRPAAASAEMPAAPAAPARKLREDWPFLADPACPPELKILAANKITAYHNYTRAHDHLFDCTRPEEQFATVRNVVENYIENRAIIKEFLFYKEHGHALAKHPVFNEFKEIRLLRKLNIVDLLTKKRRLEDSIWRINSEIKKGNKKHLQAEREHRLQQKKNLLAEVERLIADFNR